MPDIRLPGCFEPMLTKVMRVPRCAEASPDGGHRSKHAGCPPPGRRAERRWACRAGPFGFIRTALLIVSIPFAFTACSGGTLSVGGGSGAGSVPGTRDLSLEVGTPVDIQLPAGSGGVPPYTYALSCSPALDGSTLNPQRPTGLVFTPGTRRLQGTPATAYHGVCDYSVTDDLLAQTHGSFRIEVTGRDGLTFRPSELFVPEEGRSSYVVGLSAPAPAGGVQITIRREPGADPDLVFDTDLQARGRQNSLFIPAGLTEGTVWVDALRDDDREAGHADLFHVANPVHPGPLTATGTIRVHEVEPAFELPAVEDQTFQVGLPGSVTLPIAARGDPPYRYALSCRPSLGEVGLEWDPATRRLHGTPTEAYRVDCVYSATDARGPDYRVERRFAVNISRGLSLPPVDNLSFEFGIPVPADVRLPAGSGGHAPYTYALACTPGLDGTGLNPPRRTGLVFTPGTRRLQGRPETAWYGVCDYSVTDARGTSAHRSFSIDISGRDKLTIRPTELFVHEGGRSHYTVRLSAPAPSGGAQISIRKKPGADPSFRIDADLGALGLQNTLYIPPGASEGRVYVHAAADTDSVEGCMDVFNIVNPEQPGASPATGTIRVCEVEPKFELPAVEDQSFQVGVSRSVTLPIAARGVAPYRYALSCRPPLASLGLAFTPDTRVLGGTPTDAHRDVDCVYSATDGNNDRVEQAFTVTVAPSTLSLPAVLNQSFEVGTPVDVRLPAANGDFPPYTYALSCTPGLDGTTLNPPRPTGLVFTPGTRRLQGRPETAYYGVCDYSVTDATQASAHRSFSIDISGRDKLTIRPTELFVQEGSLGSWTVGLSAPAGVGGVQVFIRPKPGADPSFRIDADLGAAGLQNTLYIPPGQIEGRVYVHADADDDRDEGFMDVFHIVNPEQPGASPATGTIRVHEVEPKFELPAVEDQSFLVDVPRSVTLPVAAGGTPPYSYALSCRPVLGEEVDLQWVPATRRLHGTPTEAYRGECVYSATDTANKRVERAFTVTINDTLALPEVRNQSFVAGQPVNFQLPSARGDSPPYTYALSCTPTLPTALVFTPGTRRLQGTPATGDIGYYGCSYSVTDARGTDDSRSFSIDVSGSAKLTFRPSTLSVREGGTASYVVRLSKPASQDIVISIHKKPGFDPSFQIQSSLTISANQNEGTVNVSANADSDSVEGSMDVFHIVTTTGVTGISQATGTISVQEIESRLELPAVEDQSFKLGVAHTVTLPAAAGGASPYRYALDCRPPLGSFGLAFTATTRVLGGTPSAAYRDVECVYSATDANNDRVERAFTVTVAVDPSFTLSSKGNRTFIVGDQVNVELLVASGGTPPYTYVLDCSGGLPDGLAFSSATGVLSGRPTTPHYAACDYSASDSSTPVRRTLPESLVLSVTGTSSTVLQINTTGFGDAPLEFQVEQVTRRVLPPVQGGTPPYDLSLTGCPDWIRRSGGNLFGYPPATAQAVPISCTFSVTDSATPVPGTDSYVFLVRAVHPPPDAFFFEPRHVVERNLPVGQRITPIALPRALNGKIKSGDDKVKLTYSLQPPLPDGLCLDETSTAAAPTTTDACDSSYSYEREVTDASNYLWIRGTPTFASLLRPYRLDVKDAAGTTPPGSRYFNLATVSYDVPRFTNITGTSYSATTLSIVLSKTETCKIDSSTDCPDVGTAASSSLATYDIKLPLPIRPGDWSDTTPIDGAFALEPRFGATNSRFSFVAPASPLDHPIVRWTKPAEDSNTKVITDNGSEPHVAYTYGVSRTPAGKGREAAICFDLRYGPGEVRFVETKPGTGSTSAQGYSVRDWIVTHRFRDEATRRSTGEFVCFPRPLGDDTSSSTQPPGTTSASASNPVHEALGPVHARHAAGVAHDAVRDRLRAWGAGRSRPSEADPTQPWSVIPRVDFGSLSGESDGFDYSGSSESVSLALDTGQAAWQAGLVATATRTDLTYQAEAALRSRGYGTGDHETEIVSLHPFAAWHAPSGGHVWGSLGAGSGTLRHRDALGFPSWSDSDVQLRTWALGASLPVADVLSGELQAEADVESFAFDVEGGGAISASVPTLHGRDWRAGLAWSAPVPGAPALSLAWKRLTGDGAEGTRMEAAGSVAFADLLDSRLTVSGRAEASFGLGDHEHDTWRLGGAVDFASGRHGRGFSVDLDTRVVSLDDGRSAAAGMEAEVGYGLWSGSLLGLVRPYVGMTRYPGEASIRRAVGIYLRDTPATHVSVEVWEHSHDATTGLGLRARLRF